MSEVDELYPCVGVCMADEDEAYCIGCGRPWGMARDATPPKPAEAPVPAEKNPETPPA